MLNSICDISALGDTLTVRALMQDLSAANADQAASALARGDVVVAFAQAAASLQDAAGALVWLADTFTASDSANGATMRALAATLLGHAAECEEHQRTTARAARGA